MTNQNSGSVSVIAPSTNQVVATIALGQVSATGPTAVAVDPNSGDAFVTDAYGNAVSIIEDDSALGGTLSVGNEPSALAIDPSTDTVFAANQADGSISAWSGSSPPTGAIPTVSVGSDPVGIATDSTTDTVYVANEGDGTVTVVTAPSAPSAGVATPGSNSATVAFTAPASDGGAAETSYTVTATDVTNPSGGGQSASGASSPITVSGLADGDSYTFAVTASNVVGTGPASPATAAVTPTSPPGPPVNLMAIPGLSAATIYYSAPTSDGGLPITGYTVTATDTTDPSRGGQVATGPPTSGNISISGLTNGDSYTFTVTASNADGTGPGAVSASVVPSWRPDPPTAVRAVAGNATASVSWTPGSDNGEAVSSYTVTSSGGQHCTYTVGTSPGTDRCTVTGLTNSVSYSFWVTATNVDGTSDASSASPAVTPLASDAVIASPASFAVLPGAGISLALAASGTSPTWTSLPWFTASGLPSFLTLNAGAGTKANIATLTGTAPTRPGLYTFELLASDASGTVTVQEATLAVLGFTSTTSNGTFTVGHEGSVALTTSDPNATLSTSSRLPAGVTFTDNGNGTATLAGAPSTGASSPFSIKVTAVDGKAKATFTFALSVVQAPVLTASATTVTVSAGKPISVGLTTIGSPAPDVTLETGAPSWLSVTPHKLSGSTPSAGGTWTVTVKAANGVGAAATQTITINALAITSAPTLALTHGTASSFTITTAGAPVGTTIQAQGLTDGLSFSDNGDGTGTIAGTPAAALVRPLTIAITATIGSVTVHQTLKISVS